MNHKRVERLYAAEKLQIKRRRRKKVPITDRQPLARPDSANAVWSMDFVFDRLSGGRQMRVLGIVDDGTTESVAAHAEHALGGPRTGSYLCPLWLSWSHPDRQRERIYRQSDAGVGAQARCEAAPDRAWQAESKRLHRIIQQSLQG